MVEAFECGGSYVFALMQGCDISVCFISLGKRPRKETTTKILTLGLILVSFTDIIKLSFPCYGNWNRPGRNRQQRCSETSFYRTKEIISVHGFSWWNWLYRFFFLYKGPICIRRQNRNCPAVAKSKDKFCRDNFCLVCCIRIDMLNSSNCVNTVVGWQLACLKKLLHSQSVSLQHEDSHTGHMACHWV